MKGKRSTPANCRHEPPYPDLPTVIFSLNAPDWTAHGVMALCQIEEPHPTTACGEWEGR